MKRSFGRRRLRAVVSREDSPWSTENLSFRKPVSTSSTAKYGHRETDRLDSGLLLVDDDWWLADQRMERCRPHRLVVFTDSTKETNFMLSSWTGRRRQSRVSGLRRDTRTSERSWCDQQFKSTSFSMFSRNPRNDPSTVDFKCTVKTSFFHIRNSFKCTKNWLDRLFSGLPAYNHNLESRYQLVNIVQFSRCFLDFFLTRYFTCSSLSSLTFFSNLNDND